MTHVSKQHVRSLQPAQRAQELDPKYTAQPRPVLDELALEASAEPELSVDADELGIRFLRDATEQGEFDPERECLEESSLIDVPAGDQPLSGSHFSADDAVWEQTVNIETETQGAADLLREPPPLSAADVEAALRETVPDPIDMQDNSAHISDTGVRELEPHERRTSDATPRSRSVSVRVVRAVLSFSADVLRNFASRLRIS